MDRTLRALADPTRREIIRMLRSGDLTAGEIAQKFPMTAATISHHLSALREAELVTAERHGRTIVYSLNATIVQELLGDLMRNLGVGGEE